MQSVARRWRIRPGSRYPSAMALAEDIERWLADEPVGAWQEPWDVRRHGDGSAATSRWSRVGRRLSVSYSWRLGRLCPCFPWPGEMKRRRDETSAAARGRDPASQGGCCQRGQAFQNLQEAQRQRAGGPEPVRTRDAGARPGSEDAQIPGGSPPQTRSGRRWPRSQGCRIAGLGSPRY